jgi:hypothetical protein
MGLEKFEQVVRLELRIADKATDKVPKHERALAGSGENPNNRFSSYTVDVNVFVVLAAAADACGRMARNHRGWNAPPRVLRECL